MIIDPATLRIVNYPAEVLRQKAKSVETVDDTVRAVAERMVQLMLNAPGIGLAAPQVGLPWRMFVAHIPKDPDHDEDAPDSVSTHTESPTVYINPTLTEFSRDLKPDDEGCLSLPEIVGAVRRPTTVTITATDLNGKQFTQRAQGLLARCWQHETDHLDGVLIIDKMTQIGRLKNKSAIRKLEKAAKR